MGLHIHDGGLLNIWVGFERFLFVALSLLGARLLLEDVFKITCSQTTTHSLRPPLVLVHAAHNCLKVWPIVICLRPPIVLVHSAHNCLKCGLLLFVLAVHF